MDREVDEKQIFRLKKEYGQRQTGTIDQHIILKANRNKKNLEAQIFDEQRN